MERIDENIVFDILKKYLTEFQMNVFKANVGSTIFGITKKMVNSTLNHLGMLSNLNNGNNTQYKISQESLRLINAELKEYLNIPTVKKQKRIKKPKPESKLMRCGCIKGDYCFCGSGRHGVIDY